MSNNNNKPEKTYLGNGRKHNFGVSITVNLDQIPGLIVTEPKGQKELPPGLFKNKNGEIVLKLNVNEYKDGPKTREFNGRTWTETHAVTIDDYQAPKQS